MTRVVILARVSRGERTQDPQSQLDALRAVAKRNGWMIAAEVVKVCSAWDDKEATGVRDAALQPIAAGKADVLMVWSLDRIVRGGAEKAFAFLGLLESHYGAQLFSQQEPFLCTTADRQTRELLLPLIAWLAKWESQRRSERLRAKVESKRLSAEKLGQRALWGRGHIASEKDKADVRRLAKYGRTQREIAKEMRLSLGGVNRILNEKVTA